MNYNVKLSTILFGAVLLSGCSEKSFTLQSYADSYFNDKNSSNAISSAADSEKVQSSSDIDEMNTNGALKQGPGADIAWSSTYKNDQKTQGKGALQQRLDNWMEKEWEPAFAGDVNQSEKDKAANEHFTLQHYFDKAGKYLEKKEEENAGKPKEPAHYEKLESMPVIGK